MHEWMQASMHASMHGWRVRGFGSAGFLKVEEKIQNVIKKLIEGVNLVIFGLNSMYGSRMDRGWIEYGSRMERGWIEDGGWRVLLIGGLSG